MSYRIHTTDVGAWPAHRPVGPGLQIFGLIPLPFGISSYVLLNWGELKSLIKVLVRSVRTISVQWLPPLRINKEKAVIVKVVLLAIIYQDV